MPIMVEKNPSIHCFSPKNLLLSFFHPIQKTLQLSGTFSIHKLLSDAGI